MDFTILLLADLINTLAYAIIALLIGSIFIRWVDYFIERESRKR